MRHGLGAGVGVL